MSHTFEQIRFDNWDKLRTSYTSKKNQYLLNFRYTCDKMNNFTKKLSKAVTPQFQTVSMKWLLIKFAFLSRYRVATLQSRQNSPCFPSVLSFFPVFFKSTFVLKFQFVNGTICPCSNPFLPFIYKLLHVIIELGWLTKVFHKIYESANELFLLKITSSLLSVQL